MKRHVLIVDDNPTNLKLASMVLRSAGWEVVQAIDAEEAQSRLGDTLPDLILMDIGLPGMDGLELTRKLKSDPRFKHIAVIAMTAYAMKGDDVKAFDSGCNGYITKPIDTRRFVQEIEACLRDRTGPPARANE